VTVTVSRSGYSESDKYKVDWNCAANSAPNVTIGGVENGATYDFGQVPSATCSVSDREDGNKPLPVTFAPLAGPRAADGLGQQTVSCTYTDTGGLKATASATYTIADLSPPVIPVLPDVTVEATGSDGARVTFHLPVAVDAVDGEVPVTCATASGSQFSLGETAVNCTTVDRAGNDATGSFTVHVVDTTGPVLALPESMTVEARTASGAEVHFTATAADAVDGNLPVTCNPASGSTFGVGTATVECSATDEAENTTSGSFAVTVQDTKGPIVTVPADDTVEATSPDGAAYAFEASASDDVDGSVATVCDPASGSTFALGATTVSCTATDSRGNKGSGAFVVTVEDTTAPVLHLPKDVVAEATGPNGAVVDFAVTATDLVDVSVTPDCMPDSGAVFGLGRTVVDCTATDKAGNEVTGSFSVTVQDTTAPDMPMYTDLESVEATSPDGATVTFDAGTATDLVSGDVPVTCVPASGSVFPLGATSVSCTATDGAGNTGDAGFEVKVVATTPPTVHVPDNQVIEATGANTAITYDQVTATDIVDGTMEASCSPERGSRHGLGVLTVTCNARDKAGNLGIGSFTITIQDKTAPVIEDLGDFVAEATSAAGAVVKFPTPKANDLVEGPVPVTCDRESGSVFSLGATTVTCTASDSSGNTGSNQFTLNVRDTTAPKVTVPGPITVEASSAAGMPVAFDVSAVDAVTESPTVVCSVDEVPVQPGAVFPLGTTTVDCSATDAAGNTGKASFTVTVSVGWGGFLQPLNPGGPASFKMNSTIPVQFELSGASAGITNLGGRLYVRRVGGGGEFAATSTSGATTSNAFRSDGRQYIFNLNTKALGSPGTYELRVDLGDGVPHTIQVEIRK
jgi:hypothetical protein